MKTPSGDQSAPPSKSAYDLDDDLDKDLNGDTLREECGVFGIFDHADAGALSVLGLNLVGDGLRDLLDPRLARQR